MPHASDISARAWAAADALFHADPRWRGSDDAYSIPLGEQRILWLFGDSFISTTGERRGATMIENSVAIQRGDDPLTASISFHWRERQGVPGAFFATDDDLVLWPLDGRRIEDRLMLFFVAVRRAGSGPFGFTIVGLHAVLVANPDAEPPDWEWRTVLSAGQRRPAVGWASSVVERDGHVHLFGFAEHRDAARRHDVGIARMPLEEAHRGHVTDPEVWTGSRHGWVRESRLAERTLRPAVVFRNGATEFSVRWVEALGCFVQIQASLRGGRGLGVRFSERLVGPWSPLTTVHRPPEGARDNVFLYAYKAHAELCGGDIVVTYASNSLDDSVFWDESIYWPRFITVDVAAQSRR